MSGGKKRSKGVSVLVLAVLFHPSRLLTHRRLLWGVVLLSSAPFGSYSLLLPSWKVFSSKKVYFY